MITIYTKENNNLVRVFQIDNTDDHKEAIQMVKDFLPKAHKTPILALISNPKQA